LYSLRNKSNNYWSPRYEDNNFRGEEWEEEEDLWGNERWTEEDEARWMDGRKDKDD
jgi:hypothetical protein